MPEPHPYQVTILAYDDENESWDVVVDNKTILASDSVAAQTEAARMIPPEVATEHARLYVQPFRS